MLYEYTTSLTNKGNGPDDEFEAHALGVADALVDLEDSNDGLLDSTVGADSSTRTLEIEMTLQADTFEDARKPALALVHEAVGSAGANVSGWETRIQIDESSQKRLLVSQ